MRGSLFVVATPLGNLEDLTPRALRTLREVDLIACEDTRHTAHLLQANGIRTPTTSYFEHNENEKAAVVLDALRAGRNVALVSDAGTPGVSDPGYRLVRDAREAGVEVIPIPGPSAVVTALCVSGLPTDRFFFEGFLPSRAGARRRRLEELAGVVETTVFYESPLRLRDTLAAMLEVLGDREAFLCREATKVHEEYRRGTLSSLLALVDERERVRGEVVLVVAGAPPAPPAAEADVPILFERLVGEGRSRRDAVKEVARLTGLPAREVYRRTLGDDHSPRGNSSEG
jgi:16S rRNA (cytidine1402-2'-O)-methyltransferase